MHRTAVRTALVLLSSTALIAVASPALAGGHSSEQADHHSPQQQVVTVTGNGSSVKLSTDHAYAGSIRFVVRSTNKVTDQGGGSDVTLFRLKHGKTLQQFNAALQEEFSQTPAVAAKGTRDLVATVIARGLADVVPRYPETVTETLAAGQYYAMDLSNPPSGPPALTRFTVLPSRHPGESDIRSQVSVTTVDEHFIAPRVWPHQGTYTFTNRADTLHFMQLQPVKAGTTDAEIQKAFDTPPSQQTGPPPFFVQGPTGGNDVVSPGYSLQVTYKLPPGTYVLLCFVADDQTGMPHAAMGMHKVVVLK